MHSSNICLEKAVYLFLAIFVVFCRIQISTTFLQTSEMEFCFQVSLNSLYKLWKIPDYQSSQWGPAGIRTFLHVCTRGANHKHPH
jgi:hypothetical protein